MSACLVTINFNKVFKDNRYEQSIEQKGQQNSSKYLDFLNIEFNLRVFSSVDKRETDNNSVLIY